MMKLNISEIFYSIQGEGLYLGHPSIFVRTSGCNLRCAWCDTPYTSWDPERNEMEVGEVMDKICILSPKSFTPHVVITGGEPYMQKELPELIHCLKEQGYPVTVETNGTIFRETEADFLSISPKLSNSTPSDSRWKKIHEEKRIQYGPLVELIQSARYQLKFVIENKNDLEEVDRIVHRIREHVDICNENIVLMPQGREVSEIREKYLLLVEKCLNKGYRLTPRLHVDIWGDQRGH